MSNKTKKSQKGDNNDRPRKKSEAEREANKARTKARKAAEHAKRYPAKPKAPKVNRNTDLAPTNGDMDLFYRRMDGLYPLGAMLPGSPVCRRVEKPKKDRNGKPIFKKTKGGNIKKDRNGKKMTEKVVSYVPTGDYHDPALDLGGFSAEQKSMVEAIRQGLGLTARREEIHGKQDSHGQTIGTAIYHIWEMDFEYLRAWTAPMDTEELVKELRVQLLPHMREVATGEEWDEVAYESEQARHRIVKLNILEWEKELKMKEAKVPMAPELTWSSTPRKRLDKSTGERHVVKYIDADTGNWCTEYAHTDLRSKSQQRAHRRANDARKAKKAASKQKAEEAAAGWAPKRDSRESMATGRKMRSGASCGKRKRS
jgi:hypothetical protein